MLLCTRYTDACSPSRRRQSKRGYRLDSPALTGTPTQAHESQEQLGGTSALVYCWSNDDDDDMVFYMYIKPFPFLFPTAETQKYSEIHLYTLSSYSSHCR
jgi:hypothetical protein